MMNLREKKNLKKIINTKNMVMGTEVMHHKRKKRKKKLVQSDYRYISHHLSTKEEQFVFSNKDKRYPTKPLLCLLHTHKSELIIMQI